MRLPHLPPAVARRRRLHTALAATTVASAAALLAVGPGFGGEGPTWDGGLTGTDARYHRVSLGEADRMPTVSASATRRPLTVRYVAGPATVQPGQFDGIYATCPKKAPRAIGGLFELSPGLEVVASRPHGTSERAWAVGVRSTSGEPANWLFGIVCAR